MIKPSRSNRIAILTPAVSGLFAILVGVSGAKAQEEPLACSASEVDAAINSLNCIADGVYLSVEDAIDAIAERCGDAPSERGCRGCFKRARGKVLSAFKGLAKAGLIDRSVALELKDALAESVEEVCGNPGDDLPGDGNGGGDAPPPPPSENPGNEPPFPVMPPPQFEGEPPFPPQFPWGGNR